MASTVLVGGVAAVTTQVVAMRRRLEALTTQDNEHHEACYGETNGKSDVVNWREREREQSHGMICPLPISCM